MAKVEDAKHPHYANVAAKRRAQHIKKMRLNKINHEKLKQMIDKEVEKGDNGLQFDTLTELPFFSDAKLMKHAEDDSGPAKTTDSSSSSDGYRFLHRMTPAAIVIGSVAILIALIISLWCCCKAKQ